MDVSVLFSECRIGTAKSSIALSSNYRGKWKRSIRPNRGTLAPIRMSPRPWVRLEGQGSRIKLYPDLSLNDLWAQSWDSVQVVRK